jgi:hypothetical protein
MHTDEPGVRVYLQGAHQPEYASLVSYTDAQDKCFTEYASHHAFFLGLDENQLN